MSDTTYDINLISEETGQRIAAGVEAMALNGASPSIISEMSWRSLLNFLRAGMIDKVTQVGAKLKVAKESGIYVTCVGSISATVDTTTFLEATHRAGTFAFEFHYDGAAWLHNEEEVEMSTYGITVTGTPADGDAVVVHEQANKVIFDYVAKDYEVPESESLTHSMTLLTQDVQIYGSLACNPAQTLKRIQSDEFASGIAQGTPCKITLDHGSYGGGTGEDGTYYFIAPVAIPVGSRIRHSNMGQYSGSYSKARVLAGTFTIYDTNGNVLANNIATNEWTEALEGEVNLGTTSGNNPTYKTGSHINFTERQFYGSNNPLHSNHQKWRESDAAGAASDTIASWWYASDEFDMPVKSTLPGFLYGMDPEFVACIAPVRKRTAYSIADGYGYVDAVMSVWCPSMTEMGFGQNNSIYETSVSAAGVVKKTTAFDLYVGASNADRIKKQGTTARWWFLRSPYPSLGNGVRGVRDDGSLYSLGAYFTDGGVAGLALA